MWFLRNVMRSISGKPAARGHGLTARVRAYHRLWDTS